MRIGMYAFEVIVNRMCRVWLEVMNNHYDEKEET